MQGKFSFEDTVTFIIIRTRNLHTKTQGPNCIPHKFANLLALLLVCEVFTKPPFLKFLKVGVELQIDFTL